MPRRRAEPRPAGRRTAGLLVDAIDARTPQLVTGKPGVAKSEAAPTEQSGDVTVVVGSSFKDIVTCVRVFVQWHARAR